MNNKKKNLKKAIDLAKNPGHCLYAKNGKPQCVIGQLAYIEGYKIKTLKEWDSLTISRGSMSIKDLVNQNKALKLRNKYDIRLLIKLQEIWDSGLDWYTDYGRETIESLKEKMNKIVDKAL